MKTQEIMTPNHSRWSEFATKLGSDTGQIEAVLCQMGFDADGVRASVAYIKGIEDLCWHLATGELNELLKRIQENE